jgi:hypothetical protein
MSQTPSWNDLERAPPPAQADNEFDAVCAEIFTSGSGKRLLAVLRRKHFDSPFNQMLSDRALQVRIDNQQFVRELELACARGLEANKRKPV